MVQSGVYGPAARRELGSQVREIVVTCFQGSPLESLHSQLEPGKNLVLPQMLSFIHFMILGKVQPHICLSLSNSKWKWTQPASENCFNTHGEIKIKEKPNNIKPSPKQKTKLTQKKPSKGFTDSSVWGTKNSFFPLQQQKSIKTLTGSCNW